MDAASAKYDIKNNKMQVVSCVAPDLVECRGCLEIVMLFSPGCVAFSLAGASGDA